MKRRAPAFLAVCLLLAEAATPALTQATPRNLQIDRAQLDAIEDLTEALAHDLLALSVATRRRDMAQIGRYLGEDLVAEAFPSVAGPLRHEVKWIYSHAWQPGGTTGETAGLVIRALGKAEFLSQVGSFLGHFSEIRDARFEVKEATFPDPAKTAGEAVVKFFIVGRDMEGRREWVRGIFEIKAVERENAWRITSWHTHSLGSDVADVDLFSEIAVPAGVDHTFPPFGVPPNEEFISQGGAVGDVNGDGLMDLLLTEIDGARLYINDGKGGFNDVSESTLLRNIPRPTGAVFLDFDQDGDSDIFLSSVGKQMLFENRIDPNGILRYFDVSEEAGVAVPAVGFSVAVADVNRDGLPDIYVTSYNKYGTVMPDSWSRATNGTPNLLFVNIGSGRYREAAKDWGVDDRRWGYAAAFADVNGDGWQDLYLANGFGENALYVNKRTRFEDEAARRGVLDPGNGTGVAWGDYDNDGNLDLHVTNMSSITGDRIVGRLMPGAGPGSNVLKKLAAGSSLFKNRGKGWFTDVSQEAGPFASGWAQGGGFIDFDNDGWEDEFSVNGFISGSSMNDTWSLFWRHVVASAASVEKPGNQEYQSEHMGRIFTEGFSFGGYERDGLYLSMGDGRFRDISGVSGIDSVTDGRGAIFADFDNDGDLDVVTTTSQKTARLLHRNNVGQGNNFLRVTLEGTRSGLDAFGAVVRLKTSRGIQTRIKSGGSGFISAHDPRLLFGLGKDETAEWLEVTWPSGFKQRATGIQSRDSLKIVEGSQATQRVSETRFSLPDPERPSDKAFRALAVGKGQALPPFPVQDVAGVSGDLKAAVKIGRKTLVNFWATWCAPCRSEMRELQALYPRLQEAGVDLIGVSLDFGQPGLVKSYMQENGIAYPILVAELEEAMERLVKGDDLDVPFTILLDEKGAVVEAFRGWSPRTRSGLERLAGGM